MRAVENGRKTTVPPEIRKPIFPGFLIEFGPLPSSITNLARAGEKTGLPEVDPSGTEPASGIRGTAARCWALLLARIYECLPLQCPRCGEPLRIIAFILEPPVIERILTHVGEPVSAPAVLPARAPPQMEMDQTGGTGGDTWE